MVAANVYRSEKDEKESSEDHGELKNASRTPGAKPNISRDLLICFVPPHQPFFAHTAPRSVPII